MLNTTLRLLVPTFSLLLISACTLTPVKMAIPQDFAVKADRLPTKGRSWFYTSRPFSFGEFQVKEVKTSGDFFDRFSFNLTPSTNLMLIDKDSQFEFQLDTDKGELWSSRCNYNKKGQAISVHKGDIGARVSRKKRSLNCLFELGENGNIWELNLASTYESDSPLKGDVTISTSKYSILTNNRVAGGGQFDGDTYGFDLYVDNKLVGAVSILDDGIVWLVKTVTSEMREQLAVISSALLLYGRLESFKS